MNTAGLLILIVVLCALCLGVFMRTNYLHKKLAQAMQEKSEIEKKLHLLERIVEQSGSSIVITGTNAEIQFVNSSFTRITGYTQQEALGKNPNLLQSGETPKETYQDLWSKLARGENWSGEFINRRKDGNLYWSVGSIAPVRNNNGQIENYVAVEDDITRLKLAENVVKQFSERLATLNEVGWELSRSKDFDEMCRLVVELGREKLGFDRLGLWFVDLRDSNYMVGSFGVDEQGNIRDERHQRIDSFPNPVHEMLLNNKEKVFYAVEGEIYDDQVHKVGQGEKAAVGLWDGSQMIGVLSTDNFLHRAHIDENQREILLLFGQTIGHLSNLKRAQAELERLASTDPLTGIANRRFFYELARPEFNKAKRYKRPFSVIILDIDYFKSINDTYGHAVGDQALIHIARLIHSVCRSVDVAARYGGEEFVLMLPETNLANALKIAERLRKLIAESPLTVNEKNIHFTSSFGAADNSMNNSMLTFDDMLSSADRALYQAKQAGRNCVLSEQLGETIS